MGWAAHARRVHPDVDTHQQRAAAVRAVLGAASWSLTVAPNANLNPTLRGRQAGRENLHG